MRSRAGFFATAVMWMGIVLTVFTLGFEASTHACAAAFFDPIPTIGHMLLVALVPVALFAAWLAARRPSVTMHRCATVLHGAALAPLVLYLLALGFLNILACVSLPFATMTLFGNDPHETRIFALVLATLGPIAGMVAWGVAAIILRRLRKALPPASPRIRRWLVPGALAAGIIAVVAVEWPMVRLYRTLTDAASEQASPHRAEALDDLRTPHRQEFLLRLCYANTDAATAGAFGPLAHLFTPGTSFPSLTELTGLRTSAFNRDTLRELYFRVTGGLFSDHPPLRSQDWTLSGRQVADNELMEAFEWDEDQGGDRIGARLRGLSLESSRMDWHLNQASALAYGEWTLEFRNRHANAQEARCQMLLPPRACVSRLTLWINGEPREAAFGAKAAVTQAYRQVVVVERRDPVLVNMTGPDRVLTQCFPVPPNGTMKIRLGITAPCDSNVGNRLAMPLFLERNFSVPAGFKHAVWAQAEAPLRMSAADGKTMKEKEGRWTWQSDVTDTALSVLTVTCDAAQALKTWTDDPFALEGEGKFLMRELVVTEQAAPTHVIAVVDASATLRPYAAAIRDALQRIPAGIALSVLLSSDFEPVTIQREAIAAQLTDSAFKGGRDSSPALKLALQMARESGSAAAIVWLHGPQPWKFQNVTGMAQLIERATTPPVIHAVSLAHGPNRLLEQLYQSTELRGEKRCDGSADALKQVFADVCSGGPREQYVFTRATEPPTEGVSVWDQLARHFVFENVLAAFRGQSNVPETNAKLAAHYQLVTPYSGAVVLETQAQYAQAGLKPVDASATPKIPLGVPEPSRVMLLLIGTFWAMTQRRRPGAGGCVRRSGQ